jgi:hypothetical protein
MGFTMTEKKDSAGVRCPCRKAGNMRYSNRTQWKNTVNDAATRMLV